MPKVTRIEAEEPCFLQPLLVYPDPFHSQSENRFYLVGRTSQDRELFIVFTFRNDKIRVISARDMSKKERMIYNEAYVDYSKAVRVSFPNLKSTSRPVPIRLPESLLESIKVIANRVDVPYQFMMKILLDQKVSELRRQQRDKGSAI